jgi:stearoyl-CoA desaturase (Delta-9 desaturase)
MTTQPFHDVPLASLELPELPSIPLPGIGSNATSSTTTAGTMLPNALAIPNAVRKHGRIALVKNIPFFLAHIGAILGVAVVGFRWQWLALALGLYVIRMFGVTAGYHRYFSHRTYKTGRGFQAFLAILAQSSMQKGAIWWASHHRHHHQHSDTEKDVHSVRQSGFFWSHVGWIISEDYDHTDEKRVADLTKFPELVWLNRYHLVPALGLAVIVTATFGLPGFVWGFLVSTVLLWHGTFTINSLSHVFGSRRFQTTDDSRNNWLLALITLGEGWHNNHHHYQASVRQGFRWWEVDMTYYALRGLEMLRIVEKLKQPPKAALGK